MIFPYGGKTSLLDNNCDLATIAVIADNVQVRQKSSIWFDTILQGNINFIRAGQFTDLQDNVVGHITHDDNQTFVSVYMTTGHSAALHNYTISKQ